MIKFKFSFYFYLCKKSYNEISSLCQSMIFSHFKGLPNFDRIYHSSNEGLFIEWFLHFCSTKQLNTHQEDLWWIVSTSYLFTFIQWVSSTSKPKVGKYIFFSANDTKIKIKQLRYFKLKITFHLNNWSLDDSIILKSKFQERIFFIFDCCKQSLNPL